jgi:2-oxo-4-hydroxy-4-carboxy-5-ureidoimidazoline decarboxylase
MDTINALSKGEFVAEFGDIAEHSPWVAEMAASERPFASRENMIEAFSHAVKNAVPDKQISLIRAHPDLATKAKLTLDSTREQAGAGLDTLNEQELAAFTKLNDDYKSRFGFPFIFAVKGATKHQIMESFAERLRNSIEAEHQNAISQVCRILRFRLEDRLAP